MPILPSGGLVPLPRPGPAKVVRPGTVVSVSGDGSSAVVDIAGTQATVTVPSSLRGVQPGKAIEVRVEGNDRVAVSVITPLPTHSYTSGVPIASALRTLPSTAAPKANYFPAWTRLADPTSTDIPDATIRSYVTNHNQMIYTLATSLNSVVSTLNADADDLDEVRTVLGTLLNDLKEQGITS